MIAGSSKLDRRHDEVVELLRTCRSYRELAFKLGVKRETASRWVKDNGLTLQAPSLMGRRLDDDQVFTLATSLRYQLVKRRALEIGLLSLECNSCGLGVEWRGKPITLEMNHINGNPLDNRRENLEILCPNCHSQTGTHRGGNCVGTSKSGRGPQTEWAGT